jgi:hypothetical protein
MPTTPKRIALTTTRYRVEGVEPEILDDIWPLVRGWLDDALQRGDALMNPEQVRQRLHEQTAMLWVVVHIPTLETIAALVIRHNATEQSLEVWLMGGEDFREWAPVVSPLLERYAHERQCRKVECYSRPGVGRILRQLDLGWRHVQDVWVMRVE